MTVPGTVFGVFFDGLWAVFHLYYPRHFCLLKNFFHFFYSEKAIFCDYIIKWGNCIVMKRYIFVFLILLSGISYAQSTLPVIPFGERKADLYYWDTNWVDRYEQLYPNEAVYPASIQMHFPSYCADFFLARACVADTPILVRGIAGAVKIAPGNDYMITVDTTLSGRLPEQFKIYDANGNLLGEEDWYAEQPVYRMEFRRGRQRDTLEVYEVYFDKPILVSGLFYVGGTAHNNLRMGYTAEDPNGYNKFEHLFTNYYGYHLAFNSTCLPEIARVLMYRYYWPYVERHEGSTPAIFDTSQFQFSPNGCTFYPFFAIIDTDYVYYNCQMPTGLGVIEADMDSITISWDSSEALLWDVQLWADGTEPDSGMLFSVETNRLTLHGMDTSLRYNVKVRSVCDTLHINTSPWSAAFSFHIPDYIVEPCEVPEGLRVQPMITAGSAVVRWDYSDAGEWELAVWGDGASDTVLLRSQVEYVELDGLDTARWYSARVRALCDSTNVSEWSDTVRFFVPNPNPGGGTEGIEDAIGQYTYLMPNPTSEKVTVLSSYQLRRIDLFGSDGKRIASYAAKGLSTTLDLTEYPSGTYILRITTTAGTTTKRLVKK